MGLKLPNRVLMTLEKLLVFSQGDLVCLRESESKQYVCI